MNVISLNKRKIGDGYSAFIVAEAGVNHNGSLSRARAMIDAAAASGVDAVKFQAFKTDLLVAPHAQRARYQRKAFPGVSQYDMLKALEMTEADFERLYAYCVRRHVLFLATPFDQQSARFLYELGVAAFKISSGDLTNDPLLSTVARFKKPVILSTGMSTMQDIRHALQTIYYQGNRHAAVLHCTSQYPAPYAQINLNAIGAMRKALGIPVGYSDHTCGTEIAIAAVARGACIIEKHFTLDKALPGPDHRASADVRELAYLVSAIKHIELAYGTGKKKPSLVERDVMAAARKSVVAAVDLPRGTVIVPHMLACKRPGTGISPVDIRLLLGKRTKRALRKDEILRWSCVG